MALAATALDALIDGAAKQAPETPSAEDESLWSQLMNTPAPPTVDSFGAPPVVAPTTNSPRPVLPPVDVVAEVPAALVDVAKVGEPTGMSIAFEPVPVNVPVAPAGTARQTMPPSVATSQPAMHAVPRAHAAPRPAAASNRSSTPASSERVGNRMMLAAAVVVAAASCAATYWLRSHQQPVTVHEQETTSIAAEPTVVVERPHASRPSPANLPAANERTAVAVAQPTASSTKPKPVTPPRASMPARQPSSETPALVAERAAVVEVTAAPATSPAPASGPFFETTDVSEAPRVETRVIPELPDELRGRSIREIVVVRVLVSQEGRPARITFLRRSRAGAELDNAIIAAVNQWTFLPARKRGEAVSCWLNLGVPVGRTD